MRLGNCNPKTEQCAEAALVAWVKNEVSKGRTPFAHIANSAVATKLGVSEGTVRNAIDNAKLLKQRDADQQERQQCPSVHNAKVLEAIFHRVSMADYFGDDRLMFNRLPGLKESLTSTSMEREVALRLGTPDFYVARKYFVDESGDFFSRKDDARYRHVRSPARTGEVQRSALLSNEDAHTKQNEEIPFGDKHRSSQVH